MNMALLQVRLLACPAAAVGRHVTADKPHQLASCMLLFVRQQSVNLPSERQGLTRSLDWSSSPPCHTVAICSCTAHFRSPVCSHARRHSLPGVLICSQWPWHGPWMPLNLLAQTLAQLCNKLERTSCQLCQRVTPGIIWAQLMTNSSQLPGGSAPHCKS